MFNKIKEKWSDIIGYMRENYSIHGALFRTFIEPLEPVSFENNTLLISIDEEKQGDSLEMIQTKYSIPLQVSIEFETGIYAELMFQYKSEIENNRVSSYYNKTKNETLEEKYPFLKSGHSFETFVVSGSNELAHAASVAVAENPNGEAHNPLFLYSAPGLGKTHLMHSIARYVIENNPDYSVMYTRSDDFTATVIDAIRNNKQKGDTAATANLRRKYRNVDILLIDDIQFIIGKESTQIEFFNTYEALYQAGKQIVISSDRPPSQMEQLDMRYRSRFNSGLIADIQPPDYETSMAILRNMQEKSQLKLDDAILSYIATNIKSNIRDLEGAYNKIIMSTKLYSKISGKNETITIEKAKLILKDIISPDEKIQLTAEYIIQIVSEHYNIDKEALLSEKKTKSIAVPRQICMYLCTKLTNLTQNEIARKLKRRNHSTVINAVKKIENNLLVDKELEQSINVLKKKLNV